MSEPAHGAISGYVADNFQWTYSVYDAQQRQWRDVGVDRRDAERYAARLRLPTQRRSIE